MMERGPSGDWGGDLAADCPRVRDKYGMAAHGGITTARAARAKEKAELEDKVELSEQSIYSTINFKLMNLKNFNDLFILACPFCDKILPNPMSDRIKLALDEINNKQGIIHILFNLLLIFLL